MGFALATHGDDLCNTKLGLGLSNHDQDKKKITIKNKKQEDDGDNKLLLPSLTLGLVPHTDYQETIKPQQLHGTSSSSGFNGGGGVSSSIFSSNLMSSVVKEEVNIDFNYDKLISSGGNIKDEEIEVNKEVVALSSSRMSTDEEEEHEGSPRKKLRLTKEQSSVLEHSFKEHTTLNLKQKQALAEQLNLRPRQVEVWFQNRRARTKLKQTEIDCKQLRKYCEKLTEENQRLQKELQELKSLKIAGPEQLLKQLPATTVAMCPSCGRTNNGTTTGSNGVGRVTSSSAFKFLSKPRSNLYAATKITNPFAAC